MRCARSVHSHQTVNFWNNIIFNSKAWLSSLLLRPEIPPRKRSVDWLIGWWGRRRWRRRWWWDGLYAKEIINASITLRRRRFFLSEQVAADWYRTTTLGGFRLKLMKLIYVCYSLAGLGKRFEETKIIWTKEGQRMEQMIYMEHVQGMSVCKHRWSDSTEVLGARCSGSWTIRHETPNSRVWMILYCC